MCVFWGVPSVVVSVSGKAWRRKRKRACWSEVNAPVLFLYSEAVVKMLRN